MRLDWEGGTEVSGGDVRAARGVTIRGSARRVISERGTSHRFDKIARGSDTVPRRSCDRVPHRHAAVKKPPGVFIRNARAMTHLPLKLASLAALLGAIISLTLASVSAPTRLGVREDARAP